MPHPGEHQGHMSPRELPMLESLSINMQMVLYKLEALESQMSSVLQGQQKVEARVLEIQTDIKGVSRSAPVASEHPGVRGISLFLPRLLGFTSGSECCRDNEPADMQSIRTSADMQAIRKTDRQPSSVSLPGNECMESTPSSRYSVSPKCGGMSRGIESSIRASTPQGRHRRVKSLVALAQDLEKKEADHHVYSVDTGRQKPWRTRTSLNSMDSIGTWLQHPSINREGLAIIIDASMRLLACLNVIVIALSCDYEWAGWFWIDSGFACLFLVEMLVKLYLHGTLMHFIGSNSRNHIFEAAIVAMDLIQITLQPVGSQERDGTFALASLFKLLRLARLFRVISVFQSNFQDLSVMIDGFASGAKILCWSIVLLFMPVFTASLAMRMLVRKDSKEHIEPYFATVPRSMFTVFRCIFGECSTDEGKPIFELAAQSSGYQFIAVYCIFMFFISIGFFNVISAVFVDKVVATSLSNERHRKQARLQDEELVASRMMVLLRCILDHVGLEAGHGPRPRASLADIVDSFGYIEVSHEVFKQILRDPRAVKALTDLDIQEADHPGLFHILDADKSDGVTFVELVDGLESLRGDPRRSDVVGVDLMVRSLQHKVDQIRDYLDGLHSVPFSPAYGESERSCHDHRGSTLSF